MSPQARSKPLHPCILALRKAGSVVDRSRESGPRCASEASSWSSLAVVMLAGVQSTEDTNVNVTCGREEISSIRHIRGQEPPTHTDGRTAPRVPSCCSAGFLVLSPTLEGLGAGLVRKTLANADDNPQSRARRSRDQSVAGCNLSTLRPASKQKGLPPFSVGRATVFRITPTPPTQIEIPTTSNNTTRLTVCADTQNTLDSHPVPPVNPAHLRNTETAADSRPNPARPIVQHTRRILDKRR